MRKFMNARLVLATKYLVFISIKLCVVIFCATFGFANAGNFKALSDIECVLDADSRKQVRARHVFVEIKEPQGDKEIADAYRLIEVARTELEQGQPFDKVADRFSAKKYSGSDLGYFERGLMVPSFDEAVFCLPVGVSSPIIQSDFGFHIIEVTDVKK